MASTNPQNVTIKGRLSFPVFTHDEAVKRNAKSKYPKSDPAEVRPGFDLIVSDGQLAKLLDHLRNVFLPWCEEQGKKGDKSGLTAAQVKKLLKTIDEDDWETETILGLIKGVHEKTAELAPEGRASVKVNGYRGQDLVRKAVVKDKDQLKNSLDDVVIPPRGEIFPIEDTKLDLYPGSYVAATLNLFAFVGANVGITASTNTVIFVEDRDRFGGGGDVIDEDDIFMDDDE